MYSIFKINYALFVHVSMYVSESYTKMDFVIMKRNQSQLDTKRLTVSAIQKKRVKNLTINKICIIFAQKILKLKFKPCSLALNC